MLYASTKGTQSPQSTFIRLYGNQRNIILTTYLFIVLVSGKKKKSPKKKIKKKRNLSEQKNRRNRQKSIPLTHIQTLQLKKGVQIVLWTQTSSLSREIMKSYKCFHTWVKYQLSHIIGRTMLVVRNIWNI